MIYGPFCLSKDTKKYRFSQCFGEHLVSKQKGAKKVLTGIVVNGCIVPVYGVNILIFLARLSSDQSSGFDILKTKTTETFKSQGHR